MLLIKIPASQDTEYWDEKNEEFIYVKGSKEYNIKLEHSLVSLHKWEAKWHIPYISNKPKTEEQVLDYIKMMTLTQNIPDEAYEHLSEQNYKDIDDYISNPMTATWFSGKDPTGNSGTAITAERVYAWMVELGIPTEYSKWHFNQLMTLIRVVNEDNKPKKNIPQADLARKYSEVNKARRAQRKKG